MPQLSLQHLLFESHRKNVSVPEGVLSIYSNLVDHMVSAMTHQEYDMESFLDTCPYASNAISTSCEMSFDLTNGHMIDHKGSMQNMVTDVDFNLCMTHPATIEEKHIRDKQRYRTMRKWKRFGKGKLQTDLEDTFVFRLLSFNILAQNLLEAHPYLYRDHDRQALLWEVRKNLLLQEIIEAEADVICLQEMQEAHLFEFLIPFRELGYKYLYKKRTNDKEDGLLFLYKSDQFNLVDYSKVEFYQPGVELLNRDNVAIVAKLSLRSSPNTQVVVATTHLLYNPRRNDVRLAQTQVLLAEIERIAFVENTMEGSKYLPIILSGDFNLKPFTGVYEFITKGHFEYVGKGRNLEPVDYRSLPNSLIPPRLYITDNCQYFYLLTKRVYEGTEKIKLQNSESNNAHEIACNTTMSGHTEVNVNTNESQIIEIADGYTVKFSSGTLTHPFKLRSVYKHVNKYGESEATTNQNEWITVDYIFYSDVEPVEKYTLPTVQMCATLPTIPNFAIGSDHLCLGASFKIQKRK